MEAMAAARRWADVWSRAWPRADTDAIAALYADDAVFHSHPFRERQTPAEYVAWAFGEQAAAECRFGEPVAADDRAAVDWWAVITDRDGSGRPLPAPRSSGSTPTASWSSNATPGRRGRPARVARLGSGLD